MKLFEFFDDEFSETYPRECQYIWDTISSLGTPNFERKDVEKFWREYSDSRWCSGFLIPDVESVCDFAHWLSEKSKE